GVPFWGHGGAQAGTVVPAVAPIADDGHRRPAWRPARKGPGLEPAVHHGSRRDRRRRWDGDPQRQGGGVGGGRPGSRNDDGVGAASSTRGGREGKPGGAASRNAGRAEGGDHSGRQTGSTE